MMTWNLALFLVAISPAVFANAQETIPRAYMGQGYCSSGFLRGSDGVWTVNGCLNTCAEEEDCYAISVIFGVQGRCSRYSSTADCYDRVTDSSPARAHDTYDFPFRTSELWPYVGEGYCADGFLRGTTNGYYTVESCMAVCHGEEDCRFISVVEGENGRCSRYSENTTCSNRRVDSNFARDHKSFRNCPAICKGVHPKKCKKQGEKLDCTCRAKVNEEGALKCVAA